MTSGFLLSLLVGFGQGLLHGVGPDHCAAVATLGTSTGGRSRAAFGTALRFAFGHSVVLAGLAAVCLIAGFGLSEAFERYAELFGGTMLVALALTALFFPGALHHGHPHLPGHDDDHRHARISTAAGALMAISGTRSLLLALPPLLVGTTVNAGAWAYLPGFALGILVSMGVVGLIVSVGLATVAESTRRWVDRAVALSSGALGVAWIAARL